jgi:PAS domain S-box-containing protein
MHLIRDITHRKRHEAALREERDRAQSYLDIAGGIILALDRKGQISLINLPGAELLGYAPAELIGRDWYNTCVPESERAARRAAFRDATARRARPQPSVQFSENTVLTRDGRELTIAWHDTAIRGERGETTGMLSSGYDVTQRKQAEADREKLILELDAYAHTVAHDLSGPLTAVMGFTDLLKTNPALAENADARENLLHIEASASRMKNIIEELLKLAGVRKADVELEPVDMSQVVLAALERLTFMIQEHKPEVVLPEVWPAAIGHAPWVEEVWVNYFSNAMKYGGRPPRIELGAKVLNASFVLFWVQDNGPGLDDDQRRRLFTEFTRMHQSTASGQGLGLSIVRRIMEKLGGDVWLESQPGRGSRFGFILPAVPPGPR